ncbi:uncharacterized protein LOC110410761 [Herrania umbratica]|uniref:Uncharacterized protein LOC110410761 n=1 Tax=Herrania umbratica TaxID=108875 RepID=A0A6J0ZPV9_9ROSI|nr:uncharacterized protein LOC110410761 [Herrania umbratica]
MRLIENTMKKKPSNIKSLPREMLAEILRHAASNSIVDFRSVKLSCKAFLEASNDNYIFENVSMENISPVPWYKKEKIFLKRCKDAKNAEALYRTGMLNFFSKKKLESGLRYLKKAVEKDHVEAKYVYGIILICLGGELKQKGLQIVSSLDRTSSSTRNKTNKMLSVMWVRVSLQRPKESVHNTKLSCNSDDNLSSDQGQAWEAKYNPLDNLSCCNSCFWETEATLFSDMSSIRLHFLLNRHAAAPEELRTDWSKFSKDYFRNHSTLVSVFLLTDASIPAKKIDLEYASWLGPNQIPKTLIFTKCDKRKKKKNGAKRPEKT